jgi:hypothetical protein
MLVDNCLNLSIPRLFALQLRVILLNGALVTCVQVTQRPSRHKCVLKQGCAKQFSNLNTVGK